MSTTRTTPKRLLWRNLWTSLLACGALAGCGARPTLKGVRAVRTQVESSVTTTSSGTVSADQQAVLGFGGTGRASRIGVHPGAKVRQGQLLAELENTDLKSIVGTTEREYKRSQELFRSGLVAKAALDEARKAYDVARSNLDKSLIRAPFDGVITEVNLDLGALAGVGSTGTGSGSKPPMRIIDLKPRLVKGDIDEVDLSKVKVGDAARVKILAARPAPYTARVTRVVPYVSTTKEQDRTSEIELQITDSQPESIPVGASADVEIITMSKDGALAVPSRTLLGRPGERAVFRFDEGVLRRAPVKPGIGNYNRTEILSGLNEGDIVVYPPEDVELKDGMRSKAELQPWP